MTRDRNLHFDEVMDLTGLRRTHLYGLMKRGEFPVGTRVGKRAVRWKLSVVQAWIDARPSRDEAPIEPVRRSA